MGYLKKFKNCFHNKKKFYDGEKMIMMAFDDDEWDSIPKLNNITVCKRSRLYDWCARHIPYWKLPFKDKRQRVRCRQYFRWHYLRKLQKKMVAMFNATHFSKIDYGSVGKLFTDMPFEWEIIRKDV